MGSHRRESHQRRHAPPGFTLSTYMDEPSPFMSGHIPDLLRSHGRSGRHRSNGQELGLLGHSFDPFTQLSQPLFHQSNSLMSPFNFDMMNPGGSHQPGGFYQSSMSVMSSYIDENGEQKVERYKKAAYGNTQKDMHEVKEAYSNSMTSKDYMAVERRHRNKGVQLYKQRDNNTQVIEETRQPINMDEDDVEEFHNQWNQEFSPYIPQLSEGPQQYHRIREQQRRQLM